MNERPTPYEIIVMWWASTLIRGDETTAGEHAKRLLAQLNRYDYEIVRKAQT